MARLWTVCRLAALLAGAAFSARAQGVPPPCCVIAAATPVDIELTELVTSRTAKPDAMFGIWLARDIVVDGRVVLAAGATGQGQVVDCAPAGLAGRPGKLILAARFVDQGAVHLPLHSFKLSGSGRDDSKTAIALTATPYVGLLAVAIHGGNIDYPIGTRAIAKVSADTFVAVTAPPSAGAPPPVSPKENPP